jgi:hypothetical protein
MAEYHGEHGVKYDRGCGPFTTQQPPESGSCVDLLFWMVSGILIVGPAPVAACNFLPKAALSTENFVTALKLVPPAAILGGIPGMFYGWNRPRRPPS